MLNVYSIVFLNNPVRIWLELHQQYHHVSLHVIMVRVVVENCNHMVQNYHYLALEDQAKRLRIHHHRDLNH